MISREYRISRKKDFDLILKSKLKFYSNNLVLRFSKNELSKSRFCVVVSKKISKRAVDRNRIRRRIYEILRLNYNKIKPNFDFMIFVKSGVLKMKYVDIEKELLILLKNSKSLLWNLPDKIFFNKLSNLKVENIIYMIKRKKQELSNGLKKVILFLIRLYQKTFSPDTGWSSLKHPYGFCRHYPTCSNYSYEAIEKYGIIKGVFLSIKRIIKCNPLSKGGYDPLK